MATAGTGTVKQGTGETERPALLAGRILTAAHSGDLAGLEAGLERAESADWRASACSGIAEQADLLTAVAARMRHAIRGFRHHLSPPLRGAEIHLRLLEHLAQSSARLL